MRSLRGPIADDHGRALAVWTTRWRSALGEGAPSLVDGRRSIATQALCACVGAAVLLLATLGTTAAESKRVLVLHSFGRDFKPWSDYAGAIRVELDRQSPWPLDFDEHSLFSARSSDENPESPFVRYLSALYAKRGPDLIVSIGAPAAAFVQRNRPQLFPSTPMVLTVVDQRRVRYSVLTDNDTVVAVAIDYLAALENILQVLPDTKNIAVIVGSSPIERFWREEISREAQPLTGQIAFTWYSHLSFEEILKHAASLPPKSAIFWELMIVDAAGVVHDEGKALARLYAVANAPIFSYTDSFFGREIVGGPHVPVLEAGRKVAEVAVRILGGERAGDIKIPPVGMGRAKFDWREMQRWRISESRLPPGSAVHFRNPSAWEQYRAQFLGIIAVVSAQFALIGWLLHEHRRRRRSEAEAHELSGQLITAQEEERARLARELHDDVTQRLALLAIDAGREEKKAVDNGGRDAFHAMREGLARLSKDVHALSHNLHPAILEDLGLREALRSECELVAQTCSFRVDLTADDIPERMPRDIGLCLFRITQEGLRNVARHADASLVTIDLRRAAGGVQLTVQDNGNGFDAERPHNGARLGHASMRQRVALLRGTLRIRSKPAIGTVISAWLPLK